jgi:cytochrome b subunit of formate dehydrogenase
LLNALASTIILFFVGDIVSKNQIMQLIKSVISAAMGVQSDENRRREFEQGSLLTYVIAGVIFTVLFVGGLILLVSMIL